MKTYINKYTGEYKKFNPNINTQKYNRHYTVTNNSNLNVKTMVASIMKDKITNLHCNAESVLEANLYKYLSNFKVADVSNANLFDSDPSVLIFYLLYKIEKQRKNSLEILDTIKDTIPELNRYNTNELIDKLKTHLTLF